MKCATCGYRLETGNKGPECAECVVARLEREGDAISAQVELDAEERYARAEDAWDDRPGRGQR